MCWCKPSGALCVAAVMCVVRFSAFHRCKYRHRVQQQPFDVKAAKLFDLLRKKSEAAEMSSFLMSHWPSDRVRRCS